MLLLKCTFTTVTQTTTCYVQGMFSLQDASNHVFLARKVLNSLYSWLTQSRNLAFYSI